MRIIPKLLIASAVALSLAACGDKKQSKDIIAKKPVVKAPASPVRMQDYNHHETVEWLGAQYGIGISRRADTSLPVISDEGGGKYYDNKIEVIKVFFICITDADIICNICSILYNIKKEPSSNVHTVMCVEEYICFSINAEREDE